MNSKMTDILKVLDQVDFTLLLFSDTVENVDAAITILDGTIDTNIEQFGIVVTYDVDKANETIQSKFGNKSELIRVVSYEDYANLSLFSASVIIFDSITKLINYFNAPALKEATGLEYDDLNNFLKLMLRQNNKMLAILDEVLTPMDDTEIYLPRDKCIRYINGVIGSNSLILKCNFDGDICKKFEMTKYRSYMSNEQIAKVMSLPTPNQFSNWKNPLSDTDEDIVNIIAYSNILYPFNIQALLDTDSEDLPDLPSLIRAIGYKELLKNAPKILQLLDVVNLNFKSRHIIYTAYPNYYGAELLKALFDDLDKGSPTVGEIYYKNNCIYIDPSLPYETQLALMDEYNRKDESDSNDFIHKVLIISSPLVARPLETDFYHILDFNLGEAFNQIKEIYKESNYGAKSLTKLKVHLHYTTYKDKLSGGDALSLNADIVNQLCDEVNKSNSQKEYLVSASYNVGQKDGRFVIELPN